MVDKMHEWITTGERPLPSFVIPFAKSVSGGSDDDSDDDDEDDDDDDEDDDDLADMSEEELRAALKETKESLSKAGGSVKSKRDKIKKLNRELDEARKPKPKAKADADDDTPDLDVIRHEARTEGSKEGIAKAKRFAARADLLAAGVSPDRVAKAVGLLPLDDLDLDDDGLDGIDDEIEDLRKGWPELFAKKRVRRQSTAGERDADGDKGERRGKREGKSASQRAADQLLGRGRD